MAITVKNNVIKMPEAGDTLTLHCAKCEVVEGQYGEQVKFTDTRGQQLFLPRKSADYNLGKKCGFGELNPDGKTWNVHYGDVDGHTLVFTRDPSEKPGAAPYWDIRTVVPNVPQHRPSLTEQAKAEAERVRKAKGLPPDDGGSMGPYIPGLDDVPPPTDEDSPYGAEDGMPPVSAPSKSTTLTAEQANKEGAINAAYARAYAFVLGVQGAAATADSVQAGTATLLIQYSRAGIC